jgi:hypothetical protein
MPGQFQLPGIFRWTPIADQPWAPAADGDTRVTSDTPPTHSMHYLLDVP